MNDSVTIYHNPRCSKSRQTLALLEDRGINPEIVEYLRTPPDADTLAMLAALLEVAPRALLRKKEAPYAELGLADEKLADRAILEAVAEHPILLERPIVVRGKRAVIGRPPENVHQLFDDA